MNTLLASLPLVTILVLMVKYRWSGSKAGAAGWAAALIIAALRFGAGPGVLLWAQVEAIPGVVRALHHLGRPHLLPRHRGRWHIGSDEHDSAAPGSGQDTANAPAGLWLCLLPPGRRWLWRSGRSRSADSGLDGICSPPGSDPHLAWAQLVDLIRITGRLIRSTWYQLRAWRGRSSGRGWQASWALFA